MLGRGNPGTIKGQIAGIRPLPCGNCAGQVDRAHNVTGCEIFMVAAYAIKSIVLIDFADACQDGTCYSILAAEQTPAKRCVFGNLRESPPVLSTRVCASACSLRNQPCAGAESISCAETGFTETGEMLKSNSVAALYHDPIEAHLAVKELERGARLTE
jgi:hypothetical protein